MRLYLSSYKIGNSPDRLQKMVGKNKKTAIICNALDVYNDLERRKESEQNEIRDLNALGFDAEIFDLRNYFNNNSSLKDDLSKYGLVWVRGGNSFVLRRAMKQSGFDKVIVDMLKNDEIVYGGYSAGVCVLAPSLIGLDLVDDKDTVPDKYGKEIIWDGLKIIDYSFAPHYKSDHPESEMVNKQVDYLIENKILFKALRDGEVIIIY